MRLSAPMSLILQLHPRQARQSSSLGVTHIENVDSFLFFFDREHNAMRFEHQLPEVLFERLPLSRERTTLRELFQSVNLSVERLNPPRGI
jgi:hypothetical protein